ncbi:MAG TPA: molybdenum ABC transporter ATP-binding protein [Terriglobales bacterium]|nr:molybdenum ABC transporter ATP-binding protein [Terriglobales bacterium]
MEVSAATASGLEVQIRKRFQKEGQSFSLDVAFSISQGITIVFGASGAGKTTLLDCIAGLTKPDAGTIAAGRILFDSERKINLSARERNLGYVFQELALFPHLSVEANIAYGLAHMDAATRELRCDAITKSFRIPHLRLRKPAEISGGERQRAALARSLVTEPCLLLLDEPLTALDLATKSRIIDDLRAWNESHRIPILYVTHSREEALALGERILVLEQGALIADGSPHQVLTAPRLETIASLSGFENVFDVSVDAIHEERGTMTCSVTGTQVHLETPLVRANVGDYLRVGIGAGDVLLATAVPAGLSARNIIRGEIVSLAQRDVIVSARVDCGVEFDVHLTLAARDSLQLQSGREVWLVIKTHSCHLLRP